MVIVVVMIIMDVMVLLVLIKLWMWMLLTHLVGHMMVHLWIIWLIKMMMMMIHLLITMGMLIILLMRWILLLMKLLLVIQLMLLVVKMHVWHLTLNLGIHILISHVVITVVLEQQILKLLLNNELLVIDIVNLTGFYLSQIFIILTRPLERTVVLIIVIVIIPVAASPSALVIANRMLVPLLFGRLQILLGATRLSSLPLLSASTTTARTFIRITDINITLIL